MVIIGLVCALSVAAQERIEKRYSIFFRVGKSDIDMTYMGNAHTIETMTNDIRATLAVDGNALDSLLIYASTSPEGSVSLNKRLAIQRARTASAILKEIFPEADSDQVKIESRANDWSGMILTLRRDTTVRYRNEILQVLMDPEITNKEAAIRSMTHAYAEIRDNMFGNMRTATITLRVIGEVDEFTTEPVVREKLAEVNVLACSPVIMSRIPSKSLGYKHVQQDVAKEYKPFYMAVKNNTLYDAALVPNVGLEFYLGKNMSLAGNWMYSWWKNDNVHWYWRTYGGDLAVRHWFGDAADKKPLQGHHVGLYGQIITYDFELGNRGYLGDRWSYGGGVEYGYSFPVKKRLNIDLNIGVGFLGGEFKEYLPIDGHYVWQATKRRQFVGPTKLEISLAWLIGRGNINAEKGGKR